MENNEYHNARMIATHYQIARYTFIPHQRYALNNNVQRKLAREYSVKSTPFSKKQLHYFDNKITNPLNYQPKEKAKMTRWVHRFYSRFLLLVGKDVFGYMMKPLYFYRMFITSNPIHHALEDNHIYDYVCGKRINSYLHIHTVMMKLRKRLTRVHSPFFILNDNLVNMFNPKSIFNIHIHGTVVSTIPLHLHQVNSKLNSYLYAHLGYPVNDNQANTPILSKLMNTKTDISKQVIITPTNARDKTNYRSLLQWLIHSNRSNILALGSKNKDVRAWDHMNDYHTKGKIKYVLSALNTCGYVTFNDVRDVLNPNRIITEQTRYHHIRTKHTSSIKHVLARIRYQSRSEKSLYRATAKRLSIIHINPAIYNASNPFVISLRYQLHQLQQARDVKVQQRNHKLVNYWLESNISEHNNIYFNVNGKVHVIKSITLNHSLIHKLMLELVGIYFGGISSLGIPARSTEPVFTKGTPTVASPSTFYSENISKILDQTKKELYLFNSS